MNVGSSGTFNNYNRLVVSGIKQKLVLYKSNVKHEAKIEKIFCVYVGCNGYRQLRVIKPESVPYIRYAKYENNL